MGRDEPVRVFEDEVVETRKRTIHVFEELTARVSAWHAGRHITDFTAFTHLPTAITEAEEICERYSINKRSSLHIRVDVEQRRVFKVRDPSDRFEGYLSQSPRPDEVIMRRHVWDSHKGILHARRVEADVELSMPYGVKAADDPGDQIVQILAAVQPRMGPKWPFFYEGLGLGEIRSTFVERRDAGPPKGDPDRLSKSMDRWGELAIKGRLSLEIPDHVKAAQVQSHLKEIDMSILLDRNFLGGVVNRMCIYSGTPTLRFRVTYPAALDGQVVVPALEHMT